MTEFDSAVVGLQAQGVRGLVVDVRFNPGGDMGVACDIVDRFLSEGVIVVTRNRHEVEAVTQATAGQTLPEWPVVLLVNAGSASGAEILAGALQDHRRATIVGERSFGKGSVQTVFELDQQFSALRLTTAYYYLPSGRLIHRRPQAGAQESWGIDPDVEVPLTVEQVTAMLDSWLQSTVIGNGRQDSPQHPILIDPQLHKALELLRDRP